MHAILERSSMVFAGGKTLVMNMSQQFSQEVIVPILRENNHYLAFPLSEKGKKRCNLISFGFTYLMESISHILVKVFKCMSASSTVEPPNWFC
jgi:hypothetical protein